MKKYFIDEAETFAISDDLDARVELMGWQETPIVYIDNFYKNPDKVRISHLGVHPQTIQECVVDCLDLELI